MTKMTLSGRELVGTEEVLGKDKWRKIDREEIDTWAGLNWPLFRGVSDDSVSI